jgi:hypothetical protein
MRRRTVFVGSVAAIVSLTLTSAARSAAAQSPPDPPAAPECVAPEAHIRLDHVPIAVADIGALAERLTTGFGFSLKPGRRHENGLENLHIRFRDGSALELMTVSGPGDALARHYADLVADGGGGAYLALGGLPADSVLAFAGGVEPGLGVTRSAAFDWAGFPIGHPLHAVFFIDVHSRPPDLPEHLEHANGARGLRAVWVAVEQPDRLVAFLERFGGRDCGRARHPEHLTGRAVGVRGGTVYVVDAGVWEADPGSAPVLSVTVSGDRPGVRSMVLGEAGGLWLEVISPGN